MVSKSKITIILAVIATIGSILGVGEGTSWTFDWSTTTITTISDDDVTTINEGDINVDIDLEDIREICASEIVPKKYQGACDLLEFILDD